MSPRLLLPLFLCLLTLPSLSRAQTIVLYTARATVDSDNDLTPDIYDNAPGIFNDQQDDDADGIGNIIDPTPSSSNPNLGDPGLSINGPFTLPTGSHLIINYSMSLFTPPGAFGYIDLDLDNDNLPDVTYFGPLTSSLNTLDLPPSLFTSPLFNLNTPGSYILQAKARAPGAESQFFSIANITVVPEPASALACLIATTLLRRRPSRT